MPVKRQYSKDVIELLDVASSSPDLNDFFKRNRSLGRLLQDQTNFLPPRAYARERLWYIEHNTDVPPSCKQCDRSVKWNNANRSHQEYCSIKCAKNDPDHMQKAIDTNMDRYGVPSTAMDPNVRARQRATLMSNYGVDHPSKSKEILDRTTATNMDRYGVPSTAMDPDTISKRKKTNIERYGIDVASKTDSVKQRTKDTNMDRYGVPSTAMVPAIKHKQQLTLQKNHGVDNPFRSPDIQKLRTDTMIAKYGVEHPMQSDTIIGKLVETNMEKYGVPYSSMNESVKQKKQTTLMDNHGVTIPFDSFDIWYDTFFTHLDRPAAERLFDTLRDKQTLYNMHHNDELTLHKISELLGVSQSVIGLWFKKHGIGVRKYATSQGERDLFEFIQMILPDVEVLQNVRDIIPPMELDIYIPSKNLAIEFNGNYWHSELQGKGKRYHLNKSTMCNELGIQLIHIRSDQWDTKNEIVRSRLGAKLSHSQSIYARKTTIDLIPKSEANEFLVANHIQGKCPSSIEYGLKVGDELVAVMTFGKSRFSNKSEYELLRYCGKLNTTVVGGASRLFKKFMTDYGSPSIISYSDISWNTGNLYIQLGFTLTHHSAPNYYYFHTSNSSKLYHRMEFQKHKQRHRLGVFDSALTEWENMQLNGYDRVWDCGNAVYLIDNTFR